MRPHRALAAAAALSGLLAACAPLQVAEPQTCGALFRQYDRLERSGQVVGFNTASETWELAPAVSRQTRLLIINDCRTSGDDLAGLANLAARHPDFRMAEGGAPIREVPVHLGVLTSIQDERWVTEVFRGLGYRSRGIGAEGLGRRIYIGPFTDQAALDQALALAREAGFVAPYAATLTRF